MSAKSLTQFQRRARDELLSLVARFHMNLSLEASGESEVYLTGTILPVGVRVWIYEDEIEYRGQEQYRLLEHQDFDDQESMLSYFMKDLKCVFEMGSWDQGHEAENGA